MTREQAQKVINLLSAELDKRIVNRSGVTMELKLLLNAIYREFARTIIFPCGRVCEVPSEFFPQEVIEKAFGSLDRLLNREHLGGILASDPLQLGGVDPDTAETQELPEFHD